MNDEQQPESTASARSDSSKSDSESRKRAGLEPEKFQRQLVFVTATVLVLGVVGGTCLGMKIKRAENIETTQVDRHQMTPAQRAEEATSPSRN